MHPVTRRRFLSYAAGSALALAARARAASPPPSPAGAWHQHLMSPATTRLISVTEFTAKDLIAQLDAAGIRRGAVLSMAYTYGDERKNVTDPDRSTREENDWTSAQLSQYPRRLVGFGSVNPLRPSALNEIERFRRLPHLSGLKLHFGNSGVNLRKPDHVARMVEVFHLANRYRMPIVVHARARTDQPYGRPDAEVFLTKLLPAAPDIPIQIAHLAGAGPGYPDWADEAMAVYADAIASRDQRTQHVIFDVTTVVTPETTSENAALIVRRLRQVGLQRIFFGSDAPVGGNPPPGPQWQTLTQKLPLTADEWKVLAANVPDYAR